MCQQGDFEIHVGMSGAVIPGVPGTGSAYKLIHMFPPVTHTIADSEFALSDWQLVLDYDCAEPIPDTLEYNVFHRDDGGYSGPYCRLSEFLLWPSNPGSLIMDYDHWFTAESYDSAVQDPATQDDITYVRFHF